MSVFEILTKNTKQTFDKDLVTISPARGDFQVNFGFEFFLTVQLDKETGKCYVLNQFNSENFLFKGQVLPTKLEIDKMCKIMVRGVDDYIVIKVLETTLHKVAEEKITTSDIEGLYGKNVNADLKLKIENRKAEIEAARIPIIKQVSHYISDYRHKISMNSKNGIALHAALFLASLILAFGVSNYLTGLSLKDAGSIIQMPVNLKILFIYSVIIYGIGLSLKQGVYLSKQEEENMSGKALTLFSLVIFGAIYVINLLYYMSPKSMTFFALLMSVFFTLCAVLLGYSTGILKYSNAKLKQELNTYEYREDFEHVVKEYQKWIERYANNLTPQKIKSLQDKLFFLYLKMGGEFILGLITAPFLAYGVSNTLAMCFPEAAGWIRISGLRFSPVFLVLATFMIIFAFFAFAGAFTTNKKMQASNVLKNDGFSNYQDHGVDIYGLSGMEKLNKEMRRSFTIGLCIIFIEFSMNLSYFSQEIGGDLKGLFLSAIAALVPTALLIAETFMVSKTMFDVNSINGLISKREE